MLPLRTIAYIILFSTLSLQAEPFGFSVSPYKVTDDSVMLFQFIGDDGAQTPTSLDLSRITRWEWDFDGDGVIDQSTSGSVTEATDVNASWTSVFDQTRANGAVMTVTPRLGLVLNDNIGIHDGANASVDLIDTTTDFTGRVAPGDELLNVTSGLRATIETVTATTISYDGSFSFDTGDHYELVVIQHGATVDVRGDGAVDPEIMIEKADAGAGTGIIASLSATPRLAQLSDEIRFYLDAQVEDNPDTAEDESADPIVQIDWDFDASAMGGNFSAALGAAAYTAAGTYDQAGHYSIKITIHRQSDLDDATGGVPFLFQDYVKVITDLPDSLSRGRAYRRGFPEEYGWNKIIEAYSAEGANGDQHVYFHHFEDAYDAVRLVLNDVDSTEEEIADAKQKLAEIINEFLQGQSLVANQRLIDALRIKYPRVVGLDPNDPPERLPVPPGAREETAALDVALLDFEAALPFVFKSIREQDTDVLRSKASPGQEPFPQFPRYVSFEDPNLAQYPIPIKNEYWQLTALLDRLALGSNEKAKKLFNLSIQEPEARDEAKEECKRTATQSYLSMAILAAGQSEEDFAANQGNSVLAHVKNARDLFETINAGLNPTRSDGSFIPNESFTATLQDAQEAVADAREAEISARNESRGFDQNQAALRNELQSQRASFITPLKNLTGVDPALYNNLQTVDDQIDFRNVVNTRVNALRANYPNSDPTGLGDLGLAVLSVLDAEAGIQGARNDVANLRARIDIEDWRNSRVNFVNGASAVIMAGFDLVEGLLQGTMNQINGTSNNLATVAGVTLGIMRSERTLIAAMQNAVVSDTNSEAVIRGMLLEAANLNIAVARANNQADQQRVRLDNLLATMDRMIEDLANARLTAEDLYFQDPSYRVAKSESQRRAEAEIEYAVDRLYRLAKTLEYEWTEGYANPLTIPVGSQEPAALENQLFDQFTHLDSLFQVRTADECKDYFDALKAWDSKLRRINVTSVRGPNHSGPFSADPISFREHLLGLVPDDTRSLDDSIRQFRDYLSGGMIESGFNADNQALQLSFATTIADNRFFPTTGARWNMRIHGISVEILADSGFNTKQVADVELIQTGKTTLRRFWADLPLSDDLMHLTFNAGDLNRSAFALSMPAKINGASGGRDPAEFLNLGLKGRPVAATNWILKIDTDNPTNAAIDFSKIKDVIIKYTYTYGNPPEFPNF